MAATAAAAAVVGVRASVSSSSTSSVEVVSRVSAVARSKQAAPALLGSVCRAAPAALRRSRRGEAAAVRQIAASSAVEAVASAAAEDEKLETFEVELRKPIGVTFGRGVDGGTYVQSIAPGGNAEATGKMQVGDKVLETSATFGTEMWPAAEYGRTMYAIKTRAGSVALVLTRPKTMIEFAEKNSTAWERERNAGNYGYDTKQRQLELYKKSKEMEKQRREDLEEGLRLYKKGSYEDALVKFENVLGLDPMLREEAVASYNVACCYSKLGKVEAGLVALRVSLKAGFDDFKTVRNDPDLAAVRESPGFKPLIDQYDEPLINENAIKAVKSLFGMFGKK